MARLEGSMTALVTPMRDGRVDVKALRELVEWQLAEGTDGMVPCGTTGEGVTLTAAEKAEVVKTTVEASRGKAAVVAGAGSNSTAEAIEAVKAVKALGADAALVVTPYYNKPPERGLIEHFRAVAAATDLPVVIYNIPGRSGVNLSAAALATLAEVESIVAVKQANPDLDELDRVAAIEGLEVYAGNDDLLLDVLRRGGRGGICVASHVVGPRMAELARRARTGDDTGAEAADAELRALYKALFVTTNPIPVKAALNLLGHDVGGLRLPLVSASADECAVVAGALRDLGVLSK
jgi:4-hydroxy-tetrahydrodipicolinate synthase